MQDVVARKSGPIDGEVEKKYLFEGKENVSWA